MRDYLPIIIGIVIAMTVFTLLWRQGAFLRLSGYFRETQDELKKCTWPTWDELVGSTVLVMVAVGILGGFTVVVDLGFTLVIKAILS